MIALERRIKFREKPLPPPENTRTLDANRFVEGTDKIQSSVLLVASMLSPRFVGCHARVGRVMIVRFVVQMNRCSASRVEQAIKELRQSGIIYTNRDQIRFNRFDEGTPKQKTARLKDRLCDRHGDKCAYCNRAKPRKRLTIDHIVPKSKGGSDDFDNLVPSCRECNQLKGCRTPQEWAGDILRYKATLRKRRWTSCFKVAATFLFVRLGIG